MPRFIISAGYEKAVKVWDAVTGKELRRFTIGEGSFQNVVLSRDGAMVATCDENRVRLWDVATAKELRPLEGAVGRGYVAFAPDGKTLVHGDGDGFVRIWQTATGKKLREFRVHPSNVNSVSFSSDGTTLVTGFADSPIHLWDVADRQAEADPRRPPGTSADRRVVAGRQARGQRRVGPRPCAFGTRPARSCSASKASSTASSGSRSRPTATRLFAAVVDEQTGAVHDDAALRS